MAISCNRLYTHGGNQQAVSSRSFTLRAEALNTLLWAEEDDTKPDQTTKMVQHSVQFSAVEQVKTLWISLNMELYFCLQFKLEVPMFNIQLHIIFLSWEIWSYVSISLAWHFNNMHDLHSFVYFVAYTYLSIHYIEDLFNSLKK